MIAVIDIDEEVLEEDFIPNVNESSAVVNRSNSFLKKSVLLDEDNLYQTASALADEGYGSFDRCLIVAKACKGDIAEAKKVLSKLIFKEFKKMNN